MIIRVVYDGPPEAGKTTNIEQIVEHISAQRLGECRTEPAGQRTEYFDWLDFSGGYVDGRRVRCQLMTVPGQDDRARRRRYLLERADVVVFVVDSRPTELIGARDALKSLSSMLVDLAGPAGVGLIIQANKQDAAAALPPEGVLQSLALAPDTPVVPTVAATGHGVMETFVVAARVATERVRALTFEKLEESTYGTDSPEGLRNAIQKVEADEQAAREAAERAAREAAEREAAEREAHEAAVREAREAAE
ncbi:MAG: GTPase domain-containing protein, partial [Myxococcales bacterium]|nr:GTPase domain-containing protein [Myxococcales bacterium]